MAGHLTPQFHQNGSCSVSAEIVGLYLDPPAGAVVLSVDEKPAIQVLERAQGWLRLTNGRSLRGFNHEYKRHGTTTLFAALEVFTETVRTAHYPRSPRLPSNKEVQRQPNIYSSYTSH